VPDFDAELYLRLIGEEMLTDPAERNRGPRRPVIADAAAALVAVGVLDAQRAQSVLEDYSLAASLRHDPKFHRRMMLTRATRLPDDEGKPLGPRRVVPCRSVVEQPQATVHVRYVSLSEEATSVAVTLHPDPSVAWSGRPSAAKLTDDRGTTVPAPFGGAGSREGFHGRLTAQRPLAPDTRWIELDGTRLELTARPSPFDATLERLPAQNPAHRYLWQRVSEPVELRANGIEPAIDALVAAGTLAREDPTLADVRAVRDAWELPGNHPPGASVTVARPMPEPWHSLLARQGRRDGPEGSIVLGALTPSFDGFRVAVLDLESDAKGFKVDVEVTPGTTPGMPFDWSVQPRQLAWWAKDDRGNHYLGRRGNWSYSGGWASGLIDFRPALDPRAMRLEIMPTAETTRAVISFALPWMGV
jgi:hypothetical protein